MNLKDLLTSLSPETIFDSLKDDDTELRRLYKVYHKLLNIDTPNPIKAPYPENMYITVIDELGTQVVAGQNGMTKREWGVLQGTELHEGTNPAHLDALEGFSVCFLPWSQWLGAPLDSKAVESIGAPAFIIKVLQEMSSHGDEEWIIARNLKTLKEILAMGELDVKEGRTVSSAEVWAKLKERFKF
jgi:hypothetical protein